MPHIIIEATPRLAEATDFKVVMMSIHRRLAESNFAVMDNLKSRVHVTHFQLAGDDPDGEFVVARLITTHARPDSELRAMASIIHDALVEAMAGQLHPYWWQCCVLLEPTDKSKYLKTDSRSMSQG
jgi:5-carboxymethyl-2-hydroxymuconate isomerase